MSVKSLLIQRYREYLNDPEILKYEATWGYLSTLEIKKEYEKEIGDKQARADWEKEDKKIAKAVREGFKEAEKYLKKKPGKKARSNHKPDRKKKGRKMRVVWEGTLPPMRSRLFKKPL